MTHNFTENDWQQIGGGSKLEVQFNSSSDDRPLIQIYSVENGTAMLVSVPTILTDELITFISPQTIFNGFVVIK